MPNNLINYVPAASVIEALCEKHLVTEPNINE